MKECLNTSMIVVLNNISADNSNLETQSKASYHRKIIYRVISMPNYLFTWCALLFGRRY